MSGYTPYPQTPQGGWAPGSDSRSYLQGRPTGFGEAISQAYKNTFKYQGRASQGAYWWFQLYSFLIAVVLYAILFGVVYSQRNSATLNTAVLAVPMILLGLWFLCTFFTNLSLTVRRLHDTGRSGGWIFIGFVPFIGGIWLLVLTCLEGTPGPNQYDGFQSAQPPAAPYGQPPGPYGQQPGSYGQQPPASPYGQQPPAGY